MKKSYFRLISFICGTINVLLGAGGGILAVQALKRYGLKQKNAQATALFSMLVMSFISSGYYLLNGYMKLTDALLYIPFGIPGALIGSYLLRKLPDNFLGKIFSVFIIFAGLRLIFK